MTPPLVSLQSPGFRIRGHALTPSPQDAARPDVRLARAEVLRWMTSPVVRTDTSPSRLGSFLSETDDLVAMSMANRTMRLEDLSAHLDTLLSVGDEETVLSFLASPAADWIVHHRRDDTATLVRSQLLVRLRSHAATRGEIWNPLIDAAINLPLTRFAQGYSRSHEQLRLWSAAAATVSPTDPTESVEGWIQQALPVLLAAGPDALLDALAAAHVTSLAQWAPFFARHTPVVTPKVTALLERHREAYSVLLERDDLPPQQWQHLVTEVLTSRGRAQQRRASTPHDRPPLHTFLTSARIRSHHGRRDEVADQTTPDAVIQHAIKHGNGVPTEVRTTALEILSARSPLVGTASQALWVLAQDPHTPAEQLEPELGKSAQGIDYDRRLERAYVLMGHHPLVEQHLEYFRTVLFDPRAAGASTTEPASSHRNPFREEGEYGHRTLTRGAYTGSRQPHPALIAEVATRLLEARPPRTGQKPERPIEWLADLVDHPGATPETWQILAEGCDHLDVRLALAKHPRASQIDGVRSVLLRQRRSDILNALLSHPMPREEFLLICKRYVATEPEGLLAKMERGELPYPVPRNIFGPILKSGNKDLILRAMRVMGESTDLDPTYDRMTKAKALEARRRAVSPG